ncbi:MAG TPA: glycosyltransferase [Bryobacteraceae bacterium]
MAHPISSTFETVKYWAGQRLLHSRFHSAYLKLTGHDQKVHTYAEWLKAESRVADAREELPRKYQLVLPDGATLSPDAGHWFRLAIDATGADVVYTDEDLVAPDGSRSDPVFKPAWSPELHKHCDYLGGAYLARVGSDESPAGKIVHIPKVLIQRITPAVYETRTVSEEPPPRLLVSIIICSRNSELAATCVQAIRSTTAYEPYEIVLMDHQAGMPKLPGVTIVPYKEDFNFAKMCNAGAKASRGELLLFLNDDTAPLDPEWMGLLARQAARADIGAAGALLTYPDGRIQHAGIYVGTPNGAGHPGRLSTGSPMWPWLTMTREQLAVTGACLMTRRDVFERLGGFDESFPVNYNDVDYCLRTGRSGLKVILEARARVEHRESASRKIGIRYTERRRFIDRWADTIQRGDPYWNPNLTDNELLLPNPEAAASEIKWR